VPKYKFCGPGTKLENRLIRGYKGINQLDSTRRYHNIAYLKSNNLDYRYKVETILENCDWERVK